MRGSREMKRYGGGGTRIMKLYLENVRDAIFFIIKFNHFNKKKIKSISKRFDIVH